MSENRIDWAQHIRGVSILMVPALSLVLWAGLARAQDGMGAQKRNEARGWLQLETDQRAYRERSEPLTPGESATLKGLERRQGLQLRRFQLEQRRSLQDRNRRARTPGVKRRAAGTAAVNRLKDKRGMQREQLDMRIQRETLRLGR